MTQIFLNNNPFDTECLTAFELRSQHFKPEDTIILNGFQIAEDAPIKEGDKLFIFANGSLPDKDILDGMLSARYSPSVYEKLKQAKVAIAGLGGLGSNVALMLARAGVGHLFLVDSDTVEPSNLNRQAYFVRHLGLPKTDATKDLIMQINPYITVETMTVRVEASNAVEIFKDFPIVCEAFDRPDCKAMLVNTLLENLPDTILVCASGLAGYGSSNTIQTRHKMKNLFLCGDLISESQGVNSLMAPRVTICAGHQANMILRLLLGVEEV